MIRHQESAMEHVQIIALVLLAIGTVCDANKMLLVPVGHPSIKDKGYLKNNWRMNALYTNLMESSYLPNYRADKKIYKVTDKELQYPEIIDPFREVFRRKIK